MANTNGSLPMPAMWVPKELSNRIEGNFNLQHFRLSQLINSTETDSIFIDIKGFNALIDFFETQIIYKSFQVFIVSYDGGQDVDPSRQNKLFLLFGASSSELIDATTLYEIIPGGYRAEPNASRFIQEYMDRKMPLLSDNLNRDPAENHCKKSNLLTNTRRISYEAELIKDLRAKLKPVSEKLTGFQAEFASFCYKGKPNPTQCNFKNRIFVVFELITTLNDGTREIFYLEDEPGFSGKSKSAWINKNRSSFVGVDNGHLCPPGC